MLSGSQRTGAIPGRIPEPRSMALNLASAKLDSRWVCLCETEVASSQAGILPSCHHSGDPKHHSKSEMTTLAVLSTGPPGHLSLTAQGLSWRTSVFFQQLAEPIVETEQYPVV